MLYNPRELSTPKKVYKALDACMELVLISTKKNEIVNAFKRMQCILVGKCICDACPEWEKNHGPDDIPLLVMETGRCLVPSRFMQLVIDKHLPTKRWSYIQPLYTELFNELYSDILPTIESPISNGELEDQKWCNHKISPTLIKKSLLSIKNEREARMKHKLKSMKQVAYT
jgi:hypothetical protein